MKIQPMAIEGAYEITPTVHRDVRGQFVEFHRDDRLAEAIGAPVRFVQGNLSVSVRGAVRGIHFADVPPGQAKYVQCVQGAVWDVVVDLRVGSPTFGTWEGAILDDEARTALYLAEGLGHGFCAVSDEATIVYLCSDGYNPGREHTISPFDPDLGITWPVQAPIMSERDALAPSLAETRTRGLLPTYAAYRALHLPR